MPDGHQQAADVGVAEAERAELVGELGDLLARGTAPSSRRFRARWSRAGRRARRRRRRTARSSVAERAAGSARRGCRRCRRGTCIPSTGCDARIAPAAGQVCQSLMVVWNCRPGSARGPGGVADLLPQLARLQRLGDLAVRCGGSGSSRRRSRRRCRKSSVDAHRVVGVLAGDGEIGLAIPVGVVGREVDVGVALLGELDDALDDSCPAPSRGARA